MDLLQEKFLSEVVEVPWILLTANSRMQRERDEFKKALISEKKSELKDLANS